ncbi:ABC transporter permease [Cohnella fermenti]|uniref:ABC transporter permease n=1 Tax=Cohnella fermenti TaxID=2565925 RepID=A0A4S4BR54_9BACL|nr:ABC transporter permease [Cohnella fermenti]THF75119.1 ABC transporter permease [Cohnella fermenti]
MILSIALKEWKLLIKEKGVFIWLLVMPALFIVLFGTVLGNLGGGTQTLTYIDNDRTAASESLMTALGEQGGFKLEAKQAGELDDQVDRIREGKLGFLLVVPQGFAEKMTAGGDSLAAVELYSDGASDSAAGIRSALQNVATDYREQRLDAALKQAGVGDEAREQALQSPLQIEEKPQNATEGNAVTQVVPGYTVMFVFFVMISMIRRFIGDKTNGMTARLRTTRMKPLHYLLGMWLAYLGVALVQCAVLLGFGHFAYDVALGDLAAIAVLVLMLALCGTGLGLALSMVVRSENQGMAFVQLITMGGAALGGLWFPLEYMPKSMQTISHFLPQYWGQLAFQDIMTRGDHLSGILPSLAVLAAFALAGVLVALLRFRGFMKSAQG